MTTNHVHMTTPRGHYGSGQRILDESKAASCRDAIAHYARVVAELAEGSAERLGVEARIGREAVKLAELEATLAGN